MQKIYDTIGEPRNYGPSGQEEQEEQREDDVEERIRREALEKAEEERRASQWKEWVRSVGGIQAWTVRGVIARQHCHIIMHYNTQKTQWTLNNLMVSNISDIYRLQTSEDKTGLYITCVVTFRCLEDVTWLNTATLIPYI